MIKKTLIQNLTRVAQLANGPKLKRLYNNPYRYISTILFRDLIYKRTKVEKRVECIPFFGSKMQLLLPSSTDIYLTGGKSHSSEIRLARFMINNLDKGDNLLDIGGHYGYFSLLGSILIGDNGKVKVFEASPTTFAVLKDNALSRNNIECYNKAISDHPMALKFYEFPNLYSEYNSMDVGQFKDEPWFKDQQPKEIMIEALTLDEVLSSSDFNPKLIKIDVEGAEYKVIKGGEEYLSTNAPIIVMEYLSEKRGNTAHLKAEKLLKSLGYAAHIILADGTIVPVENVEHHLSSIGDDSDNIVFRKGVVS